MRNGLPEYEGKTGVRRERADRRVVEEPRSAAAYGEARALVSALLALPQSDHLPRYRAMVHLHGDTDEGAERLRSRALDEIKKVKWDPAWGEERISNMIATRPDWCISRQRIWGVPIAVFLCDRLRQAAERSAVNQQGCRACSLAQARTPGTAEQADVVASGSQVSALRSEKFTRKRTSSTCGLSQDQATPRCLVTNRIALARRPYLEGGDQYRGWFHSSLLCAMGRRIGALPDGVDQWMDSR